MIPRVHILPESSATASFANETPAVGAIGRRTFLQQCGALGALGITTAAALYSSRAQWHEVIEKTPAIETVYNENQSQYPRRHLVHLDGTATTHSWSSRALIPNAGQYAQIHAIKHGTDGIDSVLLAALVHERLHATDFAPGTRGIHAEPVHELMLVGTSQGANQIVAMAAELITNPMYRNTQLGAIVLRDPPYGEQSIIGFQQIAARGMNAARPVVSRAGPLEYYLGELAHVSFDALPWWEKPVEAWRRTVSPIGAQTLSDQLDFIRRFPLLWPHYAKILGTLPVFLVQSGNDELIDSQFARQGLASEHKRLIVSDLPRAAHATYYFHDDSEHRAQYFGQSAVIQQILLTIGWSSEWDVAASKPYELPKKTTQRTPDLL